MIRRLVLLLAVMAIPVLTALGTQQLAQTTAPPDLSSETLTTHTSNMESGHTQSPQPDTPQNPTTGPRSGSVAPVVPGSVDSNGDVTAPGQPIDTDDDDDIAGDDIDNDGEEPESGTVQR